MTPSIGLAGSARDDIVARVRARALACFAVAALLALCPLRVCVAQPGAEATVAVLGEHGHAEPDDRHPDGACHCVDAPLDSGAPWIVAQFLAPPPAGFAGPVHGVKAPAPPPAEVEGVAPVPVVTTVLLR